MTFAAVAAMPLLKKRSSTCAEQAQDPAIFAWHLMHGSKTSGDHV